MRNLLRTASSIALAAGVITLFTATGARAQVVISEVYGGGGANTGTPTYQYDYIELFNNGTSAVSLNSFSLQYGSATGAFSAGNTFALTGTIAGRGYFLFQTGTQGTAGGTPSATPDLVGGNLNLSATNGKVALANTTTPVTGPTDTNIVDFVGYGSSNQFEGAGATGVLTNATSAQRIFLGPTFQDTNNNNNDFTVAAPNLQSGTVAVPEPGTFALLALGGLPVVGLVARRRRKSK